MNPNDPNGGGPFGPFGPNRGPGGMFPMGFPFGAPVVITRDSPQNFQPNPQEPPLRVQIGLALLSHLTRKTQPQVAVTENQIETIPGQKLTDEEEGARATALNMFSHYFSGQLKPDTWENESLRAAQGIPTMKFRCVCNGNNGDCPFCVDVNTGEPTGEMDIVVRNPRKVAVDKDGNPLPVAAKPGVKTTDGNLATRPAQQQAPAPRRPRGGNTGE